MKTTYHLDNASDSLPEQLKDFPFLLELYEKGETIPSGRGTGRIFTFDGRKFILKKEARGGMLAKFLPDQFFCLSGFDNELIINNLANSLGISPPVLARWRVDKHLLFSEIYTLTAFIEDCRSLRDLIAEGSLEEKAILQAGQIVAKMHEKGIYHGDLNCGNILFSPESVQIIDLKGSYFYSAPLPERLSKKNLLRLMRSFIKETLRAKKRIGIPFSSLLIEGYKKERDEEWIGELPPKTVVSSLRKMTYKIKL